MDNRPELSDELLALFTQITAENSGAKIMEVSTDHMHIPGKTSKDDVFNMCSKCFEIIEQDWNHQSWCELYKQEPVSAWLEKGNKNPK